MLGLIHRCNIYSTMFFSVLTTFLTFLLWYFEVITNRNIEYCQKKYSLPPQVFPLHYSLRPRFLHPSALRRSQDDEGGERWRREAEVLRPPRPLHSQDLLHVCRRARVLRSAVPSQPKVLWSFLKFHTNLIQIEGSATCSSWSSSSWWLSYSWICSMALRWDDPALTFTLFFPLQLSLSMMSFSELSLSEVYLFSFTTLTFFDVPFHTFQFLILKVLGTNNFL